MKLLGALALACLAVEVLAAAVARTPLTDLIKPYKDKRVLQNVVTWDPHSLFVNGKRVLIYSGEYHPFRLPVPSLWLDVFQKIRAMGYNGVSFYVDWALLEGKPGNFSATGIFDLRLFFNAASEAGIYLIARPGPYINAEASGGGFPGWLQRVKGVARTPVADFEAATDKLVFRDSTYSDPSDNAVLPDSYMRSLCTIMAQYEITKGGPIILVQPENEFGGDSSYMQFVENQIRNAGMTVPFMSNDPGTSGHNSPGSGTGAVDIYGQDSYPLGFNCGNPSNWGSSSLPSSFRAIHLADSPNTPYTIPEFQGGSFDPWGGHGFEACAWLTNQEFERVFYKNDFASGVKIFSIYMTFGGTNWGNLGHPGGYTSYDYGAVIRENRMVNREKYSEAKLEANFWAASPAYLTSEPEASVAATWTDSNAITTTPLRSVNGGATAFWVARQTTYNQLGTTTYKLKIPTSSGNLTIPQNGGSLSLIGRDTKVHVSDYQVGGFTLLYSTAEIFTHKEYDSYSVLIVYGALGESHEMAFKGAPGASMLQSNGVSIIADKGGATTLNWAVSPSRKVLKIGANLYLYLLNRNDAYNYWVNGPPNRFDVADVITHAGYLVRSASVSGGNLFLVGDLNATTPLEVIGAPSAINAVYWNGNQVATIRSSAPGSLKSRLTFTKPIVSVPNLSSATWKYIDSMPELSNNYDDSAWTDCNQQTVNTKLGAQLTPTSLSASDYGYNTGSLIFRGHFTATGSENSIMLSTQGGLAFGMSAWLNGEFVGSWGGTGSIQQKTSTFALPVQTAGTNCVLTILIDHMGMDQDWTIGRMQFYKLRGIIDYTLAGRPKNAVTWKLTGNLGGEDFRDPVRGPLNEGGLFAERQGYHLPGPPSSGWATSSPMAGLSKPGVGFYTTSFDLNLPTGYDIPLSVGITPGSGTYRVQIFVNGYQFGKNINTIGPQQFYPVPEGIFNYAGTNTVAVTLWCLTGACKLGGVTLNVDGIVEAGYKTPAGAPAPGWSARSGAY